MMAHRMSIWDDMSAELERMAAAGLLRRPVTLESAIGPRVRLDGREVVCLCSNDYLCLADDPEVKQAAAEAVATWGVGSGASRLVCGTSTVHRELERRLAHFKHAQDAVVTSTGWMANAAAVRTLAGAGDLVLCDKLNHASILDAARSSGAQMRTYPHRDMGRLAAMLGRRRSQYCRCLIVTDSLFSMDGDLAPLRELVELKKRFDAQLLIDEAHATGVLGENGRGAAELLGVEGEIDATVGTLSKALGCLGGFVAGPAPLIDLIRNTARPYIYTTAPPAALCAAAVRALEIVQSQPQRRRTVLARGELLRSLLRGAGISTLDSCSQIVPVVVGEAGAAVELSRRLLDAGFLVPAIRPPTVAPGTSRLRISLCSGHEDADVKRLVAALGACLP